MCAVVKLLSSPDMAVTLRAQIVQGKAVDLHRAPFAVAQTAVETVPFGEMSG